MEQTSAYRIPSSYYSTKDFLDLSALTFPSMWEGLEEEHYILACLFNEPQKKTVLKVTFIFLFLTA